MEKKTVLYDTHVALGAKMVPFAGYSMPVQYKTGVITEHLATRNAAGLFDVSHMGEIILEGTETLSFLQKLLTNNMEGMAIGDCRYSPMCNERGGVVDDLIVYKKGDTSYMMVVNASNHEKDVAWITSHVEGFSVQVQDVSDDIAEIALQGPQAHAILSELAKGERLPEKAYTFLDAVNVAGIECLLSRTGYTGEDGFELYCAAQQGPLLWGKLLAAGQDKGLIPCGLGARDTLRLEASMPLYGHEMSETITPREANLGFFVKMDKEDFIGKKALEEKGAPKQLRTGLKMIDRGIAREGSIAKKDGKEIGVVTSGTQLPFLGFAGAMALLNRDFREIGTEVEVDVRGRIVRAEVVKMPFYKRNK